MKRKPPRRTPVRHRDIKRQPLGIFLSHSSDERALAKRLAEWLEKLKPGRIKVYCTSRKEDVPPGVDWFRHICTSASKKHLCLLLLSPDSAGNNWLHFESGIALGAGIKQAQNSRMTEAEFLQASRRVVPIIYAGMKMNSLPATVRRFQGLALNDSESFNAFVKDVLHCTSLTSRQDHGCFMSSLNCSTKRLLQYGAPGSWVEGAIITSALGKTIFKPSVTPVCVPRSTAEGEVIAIRALFMPRRQVYNQNWKFGLELTKHPSPGSTLRKFEFHAGCHDGIQALTLYNDPQSRNYMNVPTRLEIEKTSTLQV